MKLTGAMLLVMALDSVGYLIAVRYVDTANPALIAALEDIFVAVSLITISVGLVLPGMIAHTAGEVAAAADRLATGNTGRLHPGDGALRIRRSRRTSRARVDTRRVVVHSATSSVRWRQLQHDAGRGGPRRRGARRGARGAARIAQRLEQLAETDPLTGVSNRRHFEGELEKEVAADVTLAAIQRAVGARPGQLQVCQRQPRSRGRRRRSAAGRSLCGRDCGPPTSWLGSVVTSSPCCCGTSQPTGRRVAREPRWTRCVPRASRSRAAAAAAQRQHRDHDFDGADDSAPASCSSTPTSPCTTPRRPAATGSSLRRRTSTRSASSAPDLARTIRDALEHDSWSCTPSRSCTWHSGGHLATSCCCGCAATPAS